MKKENIKKAIKNIKPWFLKSNKKDRTKKGNLQSYKVRVELEVNSIKFADVQVFASSEEDAKLKAIAEWEENPEYYMCFCLSDEEKHIDRNQVDSWYVRKERKWRLPTKKELQVMFKQRAGVPIDGYSVGYHWSSDELENDKNLVWILEFTNTLIHTNSKDNRHSVRCVRDGKNGQIELAPRVNEKMTWEEAEKYARNLRVEPEDIIMVLKI